MKVLTLCQPWATLVGIQAKKIETRPRKWNYEGPLAIHAGKGLSFVGGPFGLVKQISQEPFFSVLCEHYEFSPWDDQSAQDIAIAAARGMQDKEQARDYSIRYQYASRIAQLLPLGSIVAKGFMDACIPSWKIMDVARTERPVILRGVYQWEVTDQELSFGMYGPNRFGYLLRDMQLLETPIEVSGKQGIWEYPVV